MRELSQLLSRNSAYSALRQNDRFQSNMRPGAVRDGVNDVIADPNKVVKYMGIQPVMECLNQMRALRDVLKANGGGPIDMDELLTPVTPADDERTRGVRHSQDCQAVLATGPYSVVCYSVV